VVFPYRSAVEALAGPLVGTLLAESGYVPTKFTLSHLSLNQRLVPCGLPPVLTFPGGPFERSIAGLFSGTSGSYSRGLSLPDYPSATFGLPSFLARASLAFSCRTIEP
jgi:hypothetical protein